jgi:hypothetical protein
VSFGTPKNPRTEYITFDVIGMLYPYNAIFRRGLLNTFEPTLHSGYLCLKIPATFGVISIFCSQQDAETSRRGLSQATKCIFPVRRARAAHHLHWPSQSRSSGRMQESHRIRRRVQESTIGPKSPRQSRMHQRGGKPARTSKAASIP